MAGQPGEDVVLGAQADVGLHLEQRAEEALGVVGDRLDVLGDRRIVDQPAQRAFVLIDLLGDAGGVGDHLIDQVELLAQLVAGLRDLLLGRRHQRLGLGRGLLEVGEDRLHPGVGAARDRADVGGDLIDAPDRAVGAIEDVLHGLRLALHQIVDAVGDRRDRSVDQAAHVLGQILHRQEHRVDVGQALIDAAQQRVGRGRLDDVDDLIARLQAGRGTERARLGGGALGAAGIDLEVVIAEQGRRLLEDDRARPHRDVGADLEAHLGVAAVDLEAGDLADRQARDHDLAADRHARGVAEPRPQRDVVRAGGIGAEALPHGVAAAEQRQHEQPDLDARGDALHVTTPGGGATPAAATPEVRMNS